MLVRSFAAEDMKEEKEVAQEPSVVIRGVVPAMSADTTKSHDASVSLNIG